MPGRDRAADARRDGAVLLGEGEADEARRRLANYLFETWDIDLAAPRGGRWRERATIAAEGMAFAAILGVAMAAAVVRVAAFAVREALR